MNPPLYNLPELIKILEPLTPGQLNAITLQADKLLTMKMWEFNFPGKPTIESLSHLTLG